MSTQHPDNVFNPPWVRGEVIAGEDEIIEAFYAFKELGCEEQMWDWEGKDVDPHVIRKLLTKFPEFFKEKELGREIFVTYRVPNPEVERAERKGVIEALESIPRAYDVAREFYGDRCTPPIFEVILPLTKSAEDVVKLFKYYEKVIIGREAIELGEGFTVRDWVGEFHPKYIKVIPLVEDLESIFKVSEIVRGYVKVSKVKSLRVFIARSDPALNYGLFSAVVLAKVALMKLNKLTEEGITTYPIIGTGSSPFRGHLTPDNLSNFLSEYSGYRTVTVQSALKYDVPLDRSKKVVKALNDELPRRYVKWEADVKLLKSIVIKLANRYREIVEGLAPLINFVAPLIPKRRARKLHVGLYGYSREVNKAKLPRAITFVAVLYSLGLPPEFIGLSGLLRLSEEEFAELESVYKSWKYDLLFASRYASVENLELLLISSLSRKLRVMRALKLLKDDLSYCEENLGIKLGPKRLSERKHLNATNNFLIALLEGTKDAIEYVTEAAKIRGFLG
ncbi:MAG: phosphoenolpyruvate carboxylase [Thermofilum sp. ex4484_15]|nr:MAG: phosphoenolpyruvate carboxylase [Thermofilum sp. ex4484_15]